MYINPFTTNNLLTTCELEGRNSFFMRNKTFNNLGMHSINSFGHNEFNKRIKATLFLFLLFTGQTFNKVNIKQMILSSGLKKKELVHKALLTINQTKYFLKSHFTILTSNYFMLLNILIHTCEKFNSTFFSRYFKSGLHLKFKNFTIKNSNFLVPANNIVFYFKTNTKSLTLLPLNN